VYTLQKSCKYNIFILSDHLTMTRYPFSGSKATRESETEDNTNWPIRWLQWSEVGCHIESFKASPWFCPLTSSLSNILHSHWHELTKQSKISLAPASHNLIAVLIQRNVNKICLSPAFHKWNPENCSHKVLNVEKIPQP
jgi:hypothetical protein